MVQDAQEDGDNMGQYTFTVSKTCPVCGQSTRVVKTKSKLIALQTDEDFCVHYKDFNPYYYTIWFCEHCGFAAEERTFLAPMPKRHKEKLLTFLNAHQMNLKFTEVRGVPEAIASFKLAIFYAQLVDQPLERQAGLMLEMAWIYRDAGEKEKETETLQKAADLYDRSLMTERYPLNGKTDNFVIYLIGAIYYRLGNIEKTTQYLSRIIGMQDIRRDDPRVYERARNLWIDIRSDKEQARKEADG